MIHLSYFLQETDYFCGPAVIQTLLRTAGIRRSQKNLAITLRTTAKTGTSPSAMVRVMRSHGFRVSAQRDGSLDKIQKCLDQHIPVVVLFIEPDDNEGHYAIVRNLETTHVILADPWNGKRFSMRRKDFIRRWQDSSGYWKRWMMAATFR